MRFATRAIHAGQPPDPSTGAVIPPVYQTSTYAQDDVAVHKGYDYSRADNPTRWALEQCLASLEGARFALAWSSGMSAIDAVLRLLTAGDHVLVSDDAYGGTHRLLRQVVARFGVESSAADLTRLDAVREAMRPNTRMILMESPTNPLLKVVDIAALAGMAHQAGALAVVDNTFLSPYFQTPLALGADIVVHSATKYLGGHSDVVGGALMTGDEALFQRAKFIQKSVGSVPGPWDAWLVLRGVKTLALRMERHQSNAFRVARFLESHPAVTRVYYPGLPSHPQHALASRQARGHGGMVSFRLAGGLAKARDMLTRTRIFTLAESLGGVESLIEHPALMTAASVPKDELDRLGVTDDLVRLSVGIEDPDDLVEDLTQALA